MLTWNQHQSPHWRHSMTLKSSCWCLPTMEYWGLRVHHPCEMSWSWEQRAKSLVQITKVFQTLKLENFVKVVTFLCKLIKAFFSFETFALKFVKKLLPGQMSKLAVSGACYNLAANFAELLNSVRESNNLRRADECEIKRVEEQDQIFPLEVA